MVPTTEVLNREQKDLSEQGPEFYRKAVRDAVTLASPTLDQVSTIKSLLGNLFPVERVRAICDPINGKTLLETAEDLKLDAVVAVLLENLLDAITTIKLKATQYPAAAPLVKSLDAQLATLLAKFTKKAPVVPLTGSQSSQTPPLLLSAAASAASASPAGESKRQAESEEAFIKRMMEKPAIIASLKIALMQDIRQKQTDGDLDEEEFELAETEVLNYVRNPLDYEKNDADAMNSMVRAVAGDFWEKLREEDAASKPVKAKAKV